ncbi:MAG: efflux RND transporter periplasmic adaptor subunit [Gammaproteobacteria bacterium]|nr:efflux RND transporter periplasmic adaptor subunit [Gammaproteobacteria bacterium]
MSAVRVIAEPLAFERARTRIEAVGTSRARLSTEVYPASSGEVVAIDFTPGQYVKAGQILIELDNREEKLAKRQAELELVDAERLYDRYLRSADSGAVLPTVLDAARTAVESARLRLQRAEIALEQRDVKAVFDGYVGSTEVDPGDRIGTDTMITTLDDRSSLLVRFDVPESFISELKVGGQLSLETWSSDETRVVGEIVDISSRIDPRNRTFTARARVENPEDSLRPGMSFRVVVAVEGDLFASVNETGVLWGAEGAYVWSIVDGAVTRVPVQVVERREGRILVDGDLQQGDVIVVEGTQRMREGTAVVFDISMLAEQPQLQGGGAILIGTRPSALD